MLVLIGFMCVIIPHFHGGQARSSAVSAFRPDLPCSSEHSKSHARCRTRRFKTGVLGVASGSIDDAADKGMFLNDLIGPIY